MKTRNCRIRTICRKSVLTNKQSYLVVFFIFMFGVCPFIKAQTEVQNNPPEENNNYKIGVGDILRVVVLKQKDLSEEGVRVSNDGTIRMPMLDEAIPAACLTEEQLSMEIAERYKKFILKPQVYVAVKEFNANPIAVGGAVISPGIFQLKRPMRLLEILAFVNGPSLNAGQSIQIIRTSDGLQCGQTLPGKPENPAAEEALRQEIISLSLMEVMKGNKDFNPYLQGGDIIRVPEAELKQAFIIGNVKAPITINLKEPVTLSRAIAMAGGFSPGAKLDKIKIQRQVSGSLATTEITINLKDTSKSKPEDIFLEANDVVNVPGPKPSIFKDILKSIVPSITRVPMIIP